MKKLMIMVLGVALLGTACTNADKTNGNRSQKSEEKSVITATAEQPVQVTVADFAEKAANLTGKTVTITGIVDHVCKHGGQKMILVDQNTDKRVKVVPDEHIAAFKSDLEGQEVTVTGIVDELKVDEDYLMEWEAEVKEGSKEHKGEGMHEGKEAMKEKEGNDSEETENAMKQINTLREKLKESGKDHLSFYSIVCSEYQVLPEEKDTKKQ